MITRAAILKYYKITETKTSFVFDSTMNIYVELNKNTGSYIDGNIKNNEQTRPFFEKLYKTALFLKKKNKPNTYVHNSTK
jgi:hypothetical protein